MTGIVTPNQRVNTDAQAASFGPLLGRRLRASRYAASEILGQVMA